MHGPGRRPSRLALLAPQGDGRVTLLDSRFRGNKRGLVTAVLVGETDDVVFAEIAADLNLDQFERYRAGIGKAMHTADRDIDRLVFMNGADFRSDGDFGRPAHHDPMFGTVEMLLQRQHGFRLHDDALDLIARAGVDALVIAPRPIN